MLSQKPSFSVLNRSINFRQPSPIIESNTVVTLFNLAICDCQRPRNGLQLPLSFMEVAGRPGLVTSLLTFKIQRPFPRL
jgi:hypothetical protein